MCRLEGKNNKGGLTLIELIAVIVILGLIIPPLLVSLGQVSTKVARAEYTSSMVILGRDLLEEIISKRFDENSMCSTFPCPPSCSCWSSTLGPETGESRQSYDDVDDYDGFSETDIPGFPGFTREATVYYVDPDNYNLDTPLDDSARTNYKRVDVKVSHNRIGQMDFSFIMSAEY